MTRAVFVLEQHLGHRTFSQNLRRFTESAPGIEATWVEITYEQPESRLEQFSFIPKKVRGSLIGRSQVLQGLRQKDHDIAFFNTQVPAALAFGQVKKKPYVLCTDITPIQYDRMGMEYGHQPDRQGPLRMMKLRVNRGLFQSAAYVIPWSSWVRSSLIEHYSVDQSKIQVISPGVDTEVWQPDSQKANQSCRILFVGGDFLRKGGDLLLKAFRKLPAGMCQLVLVTKTPINPEPGIIVHDNLSPNSPELIALYQSCDVFAIPSKAEAFGIAAVEASAMELPVVATQVGGLQDIVLEGETGFFVPFGDSEMLAAQLQCLAENPVLRRKMGAAGRKRVQAHFDARVNANRIVELIKSI